MKARITYRVAAIVVTGGPFAPTLIDRNTFRSVMQAEPVNLVITPVASTLEYREGIKILVVDDRFQVAEEPPKDISVSTLGPVTSSLLELFKQFPLASMGINFHALLDYAEQSAAAVVESILARGEAAREIVGVSDVKIGLTLVYEREKARNTLTLRPHLEKASTLVLDFNASRKIKSSAEALEHLGNYALVRGHFDEICEAMSKLGAGQ